VDAGLGELGRFGYLITRKFGPRVRLAAVTTDLPLIADKPADIGVEDFCRDCKKCALCCPSNSIAMDDKIEVNGTLRWKLDEQKGNPGRRPRQDGRNTIRTLGVFAALREAESVGSLLNPRS
jgi:epoxyqueuosine reductase QueG